ncbi:hypothetical protein, partial [Thiobacillus sp.]
QVALDIQSRTSEHGTRRHYTHAEIDARKLTPLLAGAKNGGITTPVQKLVPKTYHPKSLKA